MSSSALKERAITIRKLGQHLGAEIGGVDLSQPLDDETFAQISKAFFDNEVVVFRNQKITPEQQIAFTRRFGVLEQHVRKEHRLPGYPEILIISNLLNEQGAPGGRAPPPSPPPPLRASCTARPTPTTPAATSSSRSRGSATTFSATPAPT